MLNSNGGIFSRILKTLFLTLGLYLIVVNIVSWANASYVADSSYYTRDFYNASQFSSGRMKDFGYIGFEGFYDRLSTFPGLKQTITMVGNLVNIASSFNVTGFGPLDALIYIAKVITCPVWIIITIVVDILTNIIWFFSFFNIVPVKG